MAACAVVLCVSLVVTGCGDGLTQTFTTSPASASTDPIDEPTAEPTAEPTVEPSVEPTADPTVDPTDPPTTPEPPAETPTDPPTDAPTDPPTETPDGTDDGDDTVLPRGPRPNFVVITTDDQRADDMRWMPFTRDLLGGHGVTFSDGLSPHPLCCPARAELITGQYGHNNGVTHNSGPTGGWPALKVRGRTLPVWLQKAGYRTAMTGKYMHKYKTKYGPEPGWTHWNPSIKGMYSYNDTTFYNDGKPQHFTRHVDDVIVDYTNQHIREFAGRRPFFVWASALAPHVVVRGPGKNYARPAPRHKNTFRGLTNPARTSPAYDTRVVDGPPKGDVEKLAKMDRQYRARVQSLQAVDEGVKSIVATLRKVGELDNTYIIFASDNGLHLGEHGLNGKNTIFEEALRVPMLVRTPLAQQVTSGASVTITDIAPTVVDLSRARPTRVMDGQTFALVLRGQPMGWRDTQLIQTGTDRKRTRDRGWEIRGVRTQRWTYGENMMTGLVELYDRASDPAELVNLAGRPAYRETVAALAARLRVLRGCAGASCRDSFGTDVPDPSVG